MDEDRIRESDIEEEEQLEGQPRYSYSRLSLYRKCPFAYDLKYNQKKFYAPQTLAMLLGTLVHWAEETISRSLMEGKSPNYPELIEMMHSVNQPRTKEGHGKDEEELYGIEVLKRRFTAEFYTPSDNTGKHYFGKVNEYKQNIKRQEQFFIDNPHLELFDVERHFEFLFGGERIHGYIDRIVKYKGLDQYQIYDVKTRDRLFGKTDIPTPLQHVVYGLGVKDDLKLETEPEEYFYDLVFIDEMQQVGTKGFIKRGIRQLDKIFDGINAGEYPAKPSPLCYWCEYCNTNPKVTAKGENCCPYYSLWTPGNRVFDVMNKWTDGSNTEDLIEKLKDSVKSVSRFNFTL